MITVVQWLFEYVPYVLFYTFSAAFVLGAVAVLIIVVIRVTYLTCDCMWVKWKGKR